VKAALHCTKERCCEEFTFVYLKSYEFYSLFLAFSWKKAFICREIFSKRLTLIFRFAHSGNLPIDCPYLTADHRIVLAMPYDSPYALIHRLKTAIRQTGISIHSAFLQVLKSHFSLHLQILGVRVGLADDYSAVTNWPFEVNTFGKRPSHYCE